MKKILFLFIVLSNFLYSNAQTYQPFLLENSAWREHYFQYQGQCSNYQYYSGNDTIIGVYKYFKIFQSGVVYINSEICSNIVQSSFSGYYKGALREDTLNKKIWFLEADSTNEKLLYDFNLEIGDTLAPTFTNDTTKIINSVSSIDSILVGSMYHKKYGITATSDFGPTSNDYLFLIEGIGSTYGLLGLLIPPFESGTTLLCFKNKGKTVFPDTTSECDLVTSIKHFNHQNPFVSFSPNPFSLSTIITTNDNHNNLELSIYDIYGRLILNKRVCNGESIYREGITTGVYFYKIFNGIEIIDTGKLIVE